MLSTVSLHLVPTHWLRYSALLQRFSPLFARLSSRDFLSSLGSYSLSRADHLPLVAALRFTLRAFRPQGRATRRDDRNSRLSPVAAVPPFEFPSKCPSGPAPPFQSGSRSSPSS